MMDWKQHVQTASRSLNLLTTDRVNNLLNDLAEATLVSAEKILAANALDLAEMEKDNPMYDRLLLNYDRLVGIAADIRSVALLPSPLGKIHQQLNRPNGMVITRVSVPFGVIGIIYEARPNVSFDVFSLCLKSGNACVLKGGSDAFHSNSAIVALIREVLQQHSLDPNCVVLLPAGRTATTDLLQAVGFVDMIIPRGGRGLIDYVREHARVPVIETGAGICHTYFDADGDTEKGRAIIHNAKTRRVSVCNSLDCLVIHASRLPHLPVLCESLAGSQVLVYADERAYKELQGIYPDELLKAATPDSFGTEFLDYKIAIKTVDSLEAAVEHITLYSSKHSECIVSENSQSIAYFETMVDAACVYSNVSTAFTDGAQFGLGAEIGISTQKLHARGPMALDELCSYKWIIKGNGQVRR